MFRMLIRLLEVDVYDEEEEAEGEDHSGKHSARCFVFSRFRVLLIHVFVNVRNVRGYNSRKHPVAGR